MEVVNVKTLRYIKYNDKQFKVGDTIPNLQMDDALKMVKKKHVELDVPEGEQNTSGNVDILMDIEGMTEELASSLIDINFDSIKLISEAEESQLVVVKGIGKKTAQSFIFNAKLLLTE